MHRIAVIAKTNGLEYDDRIRKECISLSKIASLKIFVLFNDNRQEEGITSYGVPYQSFQLKSRDILPSGQFLFIKSFEFYVKVAKSLGEYDLIWAHESYTSIFALLAPKNKLIWDLHELPTLFKKRGLKQIFHFIECKSKAIIHANDYRKKYLQDIGLMKKENKNKVLKNFPDQEFLKNKNNSDSEYKNFKKWLAKDKYVYIQGVSTRRRYPFNTMEAVLSSTDFKIIIAGGIEPEAKENLFLKYGDQLKRRVYFRGMIDQLYIPKYLEESQFSIILYDTKTPNNRYCEPNRMYQSIVMGIPVIVGYNEPMKDFIERYNFGIVLNNDGRNLSVLQTAVKDIISNREIYRNNINNDKSNILWDTQECKLLELVNYGIL